MAKNNNGSQLEGLRTEIGGLMQQDTNGKIEYLRKSITNEPDGGIDSINSVASDFDYFEYVRKLKKES